MEGINPNKRLKEEFVSNLNGSSKLEIGTLSIVVPVLVVVKMCMVVCSSQDTVMTGTTFMSNMLTDFLVVILPTLLLLTFLSAHVYSVTVALLVVVITFLAYSHRFKSSSIQAGATSRKIFLSYYRFVMMLVTCVTILAVDFNIFPRKYAKTEVYGTGLMDLGVGSFVAANAMVSRQARRSTISISRSLRDVCPLIILGLSRFFLTRAVDYQVHIGEYGVHWNFFLTLAAVSFITTIVRVPPSYGGILGLCVIAGYQGFLSWGLNEYLIASERNHNFLSLNREGVFSVLGYWSLYLFSLQLGHLFLRSYPNNKWLQTAQMWALDGVLWILLNIVETVVEKVSRRTCNMAYVIFVLAQNLEVIALFSLADNALPSVRIPLLDAFDDNLLFTFLTANLLTGAVNMMMDTIFVTQVPAFAVLFMYMAALVSIVGTLRAYNIRAKFW